MDEEKANRLAELLGEDAVPYNSGGDIWLVMLRRTDRLVAFSDECVCQYSDEDSFLEGEKPLNSVAWCDE